MKRLFYAVLIAFCITTGYVACTDASASKVEKATKPPLLSNDVVLTDNTTTPISLEYAKILNEAGFTSVPSVVNRASEEKRHFYLKNYGLNFISDRELQILMEKNNFVWGNARDYTGEIPLEAANKMAENIIKLKETDIIHYYRNYDVTDWHRELSDDKINVNIVAPATMFKPGAELHKGIDPIALVKIDHGWLELARWE